MGMKEKDAVQAQKQINAKLEGDLTQINETKEKLEDNLGKEEAANKECQEKKKSLQDENMMLENTNKNMMQIVDSLNTTITEMTENTVILEGKIKYHEEIIASKAKENKLLDETNKKLMDEVKKLTGENAKQVEIIKAKDERIGVMQKENSNLKKVANDLRAWIDKVTEEKAQCDAELQTSKTTVQDLVSAKEELSKSV